MNNVCLNQFKLKGVDFIGATIVFNLMTILTELHWPYEQSQKMSTG